MSTLSSTAVEAQGAESWVWTNREGRIVNAKMVGVQDGLVVLQLENRFWDGFRDGDLVEANDANRFI